MVLRSARNGVGAVASAWWRGWIDVRALLSQPLQSLLLLAALPRILRRAYRLAYKMYRAGILIETPTQPTLLRTAVTGLGDVTTSVAFGSAVTPMLVSQHFANVRAALLPLTQALEALRRAHSLMTSIIAALAIGLTPAESEFLGSHAAAAFGRAFGASILWAVTLRLIAEVAARWVFARLEPLGH